MFGKFFDTFFTLNTFKVEQRERERERERCFGDPFKTPSEEEEEDAEDIVEKSKSSPEKLVEFPADINRLKLPKLNIAVLLKKATTAKASVDIIGKLWGVEKGRKGVAGGEEEEERTT
ncbi:hypothetical protein RUM44_012218 [Polyplax serrata]|uniref:Uncharacterized protein n=1 Tax=Polyplax serrata TaxID=468196 RepID=A0ABR1BFK8_POLSC